MNERIKTLMGKTLDSEFSHTWDTMTYEDLQRFSEKFAELIVKKCADVAWVNTPETEELEYSHLISDKILEHFGIL